LAGLTDNLSASPRGATGHQCAPPPHWRATVWFDPRSYTRNHDLITIGSGVGVGAVSQANLERRDLRSYPWKAAAGSELRRRATSPRRSCIIARGTAPLPRYAPARYPPVDHRACARGGLAIEMHRSAIPRHSEMAGGAGGNWSIREW